MAGSIAESGRGSPRASRTPIVGIPNGNPEQEYNLTCLVREGFAIRLPPGADGIPGLDRPAGSRARAT